MCKPHKGRRFDLVGDLSGEPAIPLTFVRPTTERYVYFGKEGDAFPDGPPAMPDPHAVAVTPLGPMTVLVDMSNGTSVVVESVTD